MGERGNKVLRTLDKSIGIPLIRLIGLFKRPGNVNNVDPVIRKVALLKTAGIGDTVLLSAIIKDLKEKLPDVSITLFSGENNYEMASILGKMYGVKVKKIRIKHLFSAIKMIRKHEFDVWFDFGQWPRVDAFLSYLSRSKVKIGFKTEGQKRHYVYDIVVEHRPDIHEVENFRRIIDAVGLGGNNSIELRINSSENDPKLVVIHMFPGGTKSYMKEWPEEKWIEFIDFITARGYRVVLTGAPSDKNRAGYIAQSCKFKDRVEVAAGKLDLTQTMFLLKKSALVVSVNTGIMHIASALGCNLIALHGPTSIKRWGPLNANSVAIKSPLTCSPCLNLGFEYGCSKNECMRAIDLNTVINAARKFIDI